MTDNRLDLTDAVEAAAQAHYEIERREVPPFVGEPVGPEWADVPAAQKHPWREYVLPFVVAAAPLIAAQVAEQIAREIERARDNDMSSSAWRARQESFTYAARIAREWGEQR